VTRRQRQARAARQRDDAGLRHESGHGGYGGYGGYGEYGEYGDDGGRLMDDGGRLNRGPWAPSRLAGVKIIWAGP
jgi:hypothetical protein